MPLASLPALTIERNAGELDLAALKNALMEEVSVRDRFEDVVETLLVRAGRDASGTTATTLLASGVGAGLEGTRLYNGAEDFSAADHVRPRAGFYFES